MLLVKKKDGSDNFCIDYRELKANTVSVRYPLPLNSDQIDRLRGGKYLSSLDMASGFYQVPIHTDFIERTAFVLSNAVRVEERVISFQRAIVQALGDEVNSYAVAYIDDVLIFANSKEEAYERLEVVLSVLLKSGFSFNVKNVNSYT